MTSAHPWNPSDVVTIQQATVQGGSTPSWKREFASTNAFSQCCEYVRSTSDEALLDSVDPSLVNVTAQIRKKQCISQVILLYDQLDAPARRTFVSDERYAKVTAELVAERFGIGPLQAQRTLRVTTQRGVRSAILPIS
jgi:hypothetical protein